MDFDIDNLEDEFDTMILIAQGGSEIAGCDDDEDELFDDDRNDQQDEPLTQKSMSAIFGTDADSLWQSRKRKRKGMRFGKTIGKTLPDEIVIPLEEAQKFYVNHEYDKAISTLSHVIRLAPRLPYPYQTMGMIFEDSGDKLRALQLYALAATHTKKSSVWKSIAIMAAGLKEWKQCQAAVARCISKSKPDPILYSLKAITHLHLGQIKTARDSLKFFIETFPDCVDFLLEYAAACHAVGFTDTAISTYLRYIFHLISPDGLPPSSLFFHAVQLPPRKHLELSPAEVGVLFFAVRSVCDILLERCTMRPGDLRVALLVTGSCLDFVRFYQQHPDLASTKVPITSTDKDTRGEGETPTTQGLMRAHTECMNVDALSVATTQALLLPLDVALLYGISRLRSQESAEVGLAMVVLQPLLVQFEHEDAAPSSNPAHDSHSDDTALEAVGSVDFGIEAGDGHRLLGADDVNAELDQMGNVGTKRKPQGHMDIDKALETEEVGKHHCHNDGEDGNDNDDDQNDEDCDNHPSEGKFFKMPVGPGDIEDDELFVLRQRVRIARELALLGRRTMSLRTLDAVVTRLERICSRATKDSAPAMTQRQAEGESGVVQSDESMHPTTAKGLRLAPRNEIEDAAAKTLERKKRLSKLWANIGVVELNLNKFDDALEKFMRSLEWDATAIFPLRNFAALVWQLRPAAAVSARTLLGLHFHSLMGAVAKYCHQSVDHSSNKQEKGGVDDTTLHFSASVCAEAVWDVGNDDERDKSGDERVALALSLAKWEAFDPGAGSRESSLTVATIEDEIKALHLWATFLLDADDKSSYLAVVIPLLSAWAHDSMAMGTALSIQGEMLSAGQGGGNRHHTDGQEGSNGQGVADSTSLASDKAQEPTDSLPANTDGESFSAAVGIEGVEEDSSAECLVAVLPMVSDVENQDFETALPMTSPSALPGDDVVRSIPLHVEEQDAVMDVLANLDSEGEELKVEMVRETLMDGDQSDLLSSDTDMRGGEQVADVVDAKDSSASEPTVDHKSSASSSSGAPPATTAAAQSMVDVSTGESMGIRMRKKISQLDVISFAAIGADFERVSVGGHIWVDDTQREFWKLVAALAAQVHVELLLGREVLCETLQTAIDVLRSMDLDVEAEQVSIRCAHRKSRGRVGIRYAGRRAPVRSGTHTPWLVTEGDNGVLLMGGLDISGEVNIGPLGVVDDFDLEASMGEGVDGDLVARGVTGDTSVIQRGQRGAYVSARGPNLALNEPQTVFISAARNISPHAGSAALEFVCRVDSIPLVNSLARAVLGCPEKLGLGSGALELALPISRLYSSSIIGEEKKSAALCLLMGHYLATKRKYGSALDRYCDSYLQDPDQPLTALCLASTFIFLCQHPIVKQRHETLLKGLVMLDRYKQLRLKNAAALDKNSMDDGGEFFSRRSCSFPETGGDKGAASAKERQYKDVRSNSSTFEDLNDVALCQEVFYNTGRIYHELGLLHIAENCYCRALDLVERYPQQMTNSKLNVTFEAAHNLVLIYKVSGAIDLALNVMQKHLIF